MNNLVGDLKQRSQIKIVVDNTKRQNILGIYKVYTCIGYIKNAIACKAGGGVLSSS